MSDGVYNVSDILGKTLFAKQDIPVLDIPRDSATPIGYIAAGQPIGVVYSWLDADPAKGRNYFYWVFQNAKGVAVPGGVYYVQHHGSWFDISSLREQGVISTQEQIEAAQDENRTWYEALLDDYGKPLAWLAAGTAVAIAAVKGAFSSRSK